MKKSLIILSLISCLSVFAECVHEQTIKGSSLQRLSVDHDVFISTGKGIFKSIREIKIDHNKIYNVQLVEKKSDNKSLDSHDEYNKEFLEYYSYSRMQKYLSSHKEAIKNAGLKVSVVGKSLLGKNLYSVTPISLVKKKTILMFGRHHGDEGTANWIIEGFFDEYLNNKKFRDEYQLVLYPMINPDGVEAHSRYNSNNRDLNRSWHANLSESFDEINVIHTDLKEKLKVVKDDIFLALDMHGSIREDFIYRVGKNYVDRNFYKKQQTFIDELKIFDKWQNGNFIKSNGDDAMARIVLINHYKKNAMTHESIKNIKKINSKNRSLLTLKEQGLDILKVIQNIY